MQQVPISKASQVGNDDVNVDPLTRRRLELQQLKAQSSAAKTKRGTADDLLAKARSQLSNGNGAKSRPTGVLRERPNPQVFHSPQQQKTPIDAAQDGESAPASPEVVRNLDSAFSKPNPAVAADAGAGGPPTTNNFYSTEPKKDVRAMSNPVKTKNEGRPPTNSNMPLRHKKPNKTATRPDPIIPTIGDNKNPKSSALHSTKAPSTPHERELISELRKVHQDKEDAFRQVVRLREQVQKLQKSKSSPPQEFQQLVEKANRDGDRAALLWARQKVDKSSKNEKNEPGLMFSFPSPIRGRQQSPSRRALNPAIGPGVRKRATTPQPRRCVSDRNMLALATKSNPDEYDSAVATYKVRRPYAPHEEEIFWKDVGELTTEEYQNMANVQDPFSLEVAAQIKADGSALLLYGTSDCRHKKKRAKVWRLFDNVDERDQPLGSVQFIDANAYEGEYWLDEVFEEAMSTRETYCSSLLSTVAALASNSMMQNQQAPNSMMQNQQHSPPLLQNPTALSSIPPAATIPQQQGPPTMMPSIPPSALNLQQPPAFIPPAEPTHEQARGILPNPSLTETSVERQNKSTPNELSAPIPEKSEVSKKKRDLPHEDDSSQSNDLLSGMLGSLFYGIFCFVWFVLVTLPMKALQWGFIATVFGIAYSVAWMYFAEHNEYEIIAISAMNQANIS
mmetsp:Transcript_29984/g.45681  ORF Transcript_29984/g.45681 Transcript_29984/m.45681 type:complete len:676 (+) Transcript_29984:247-2274(+)|eukprot:CAMPEP_0194215488 /NCGR_PEP_ID=MMETSP0156-20130528/17334_1 /TAXON_ID=33649 /ORGANISM="Thalassionema nitzschioides, Strain L26-B" /LENGTH=675 /DNA_ID=CAMNT_0038944009 /DNA_START=208 /DNA_END=2235 /DNA_ORIENTATION=+